jgi:hypothetical protein
MVIGTSIVFVLAFIATWLGIWQLVCLVGIVGGPIAGVEKARRGFIACFLGAILAWTLFLNTNLWEALDIWDLFLEIAIGIEGLGFIGVLVTLLFGGLLCGVAGYFGAALLEFFPTLKEIILTRMFDLELQPMEDSSIE